MGTGSRMSLSQSDHDLLIQLAATLTERHTANTQRLDSIDRRIDRWSAALEAHLGKNGQAIENLAMVTGRSRIPTNTAWTGLGLALATAVAAIGKLLGLW